VEVFRESNPASFDANLGRPYRPFPAARHVRPRRTNPVAAHRRGGREPEPLACERSPSAEDVVAPQPFSSGAILSAGARPATRGRPRGSCGPRGGSPRSGSARTAGTAAACALPRACGRPCGRCTGRRT